MLMLSCPHNIFSRKIKIETPDERNKNEDEKMRVMIKGMRAKMRAGTVKTLRRQAILSQRKNSKVFLSSIQIKL